MHFCAQRRAEPRQNCGKSQTAYGYTQTLKQCREKLKKLKKNVMTSDDSAHMELVQNRVEMSEAETGITA